MTNEGTNGAYGCIEAAQLWGDLSDREGDPEATWIEARLARHFDRCPLCAAEVAEVDLVISRERHRRGVVRGRSRRKVVAASVAAGLVALFALALFRSSPSGGEARPEPSVSIEITGDAHAVVAKAPGRSVTVLRLAPPARPSPPGAVERESS